MAGGRWPRRHRGRFGCLVAAVVVFVVGMATVATWILAGLLGLTGIHAGSSAVPGQVVLAVAVGAILLVALGRSARRVSAPVTDLLAAADRLAIGDYEVRVPERGPRELRAAARSLNTLAERLAATDERRRALLADISHELRTPLTVVRGGLEGMLDGLRPRDDAHLAALRDETLLIDRLIDDLRTVALAQTGALPLHLAEVEPADLVDDAVAAMTGSAGGTRASCPPWSRTPTASRKCSATSSRMRCATRPREARSMSRLRPRTPGPWRSRSWTPGQDSRRAMRNGSSSGTSARQARRAAALASPSRASW